MYYPPRSDPCITPHLMPSRRRIPYPPTPTPPQVLPVEALARRALGSGEGEGSAPGAAAGLGGMSVLGTAQFVQGVARASKGLARWVR